MQYPYCPGDTLHLHLRARGPFALDRCLRIASFVLATVSSCPPPVEYPWYPV